MAATWVASPSRLSRMADWRANVVSISLIRVLTAVSWVLRFSRLAVSCWWWLVSRASRPPRCSAWAESWMRAAASASASLLGVVMAGSLVPGVAGGAVGGGGERGGLGGFRFGGGARFRLGWLRCAGDAVKGDDVGCGLPGVAGSPVEGVLPAHGQAGDD